MQGLSQLFYLHGIGYDYTKYTGEHVVFDQQTRAQALRCCGVDTEDLAHIDKLNFELDIAPWLNVVGDVCMVEQQDSLLKIRLPESQIDGIASVYIEQLNYEHQFSLTSGSVVGEYLFEGIRYVEVAYRVKAIPTGYFDTNIYLPSGKYHTQVWSVPSECYKQSSQPSCGISVQLYTLSSDRNLGIGDFADLQELVIHSASHGCDYILLNPLHLLFKDQQHRVSPYSPNHRGLLNPLYIAIDWCDDFEQSDQIKRQFELSLAALASHKQAPFIDYDVVSEHKYRLLEMLYQHFEQHKTSKTVDAFACFKREFAKPLEVLSNDECQIYWQYLARQQLNRCQRLSLENGMAVGLINDLAVGCAEDSLEFNANKALYAGNAHVGAPPDPWAEAGQDWGLPALNPIKLRCNKFEFFKQLLRSNMKSVGGLRIDHVMAIRRLWWCFSVQGSQRGCYVYYPFEHLIALLKIESQLQQTMIIGEDLGVVPPEVRSVMLDANMLGNVLFYFEKDQNGEFVQPEHIRSQVLLMVANHDVPPFNAWWQGKDLIVKSQYQLLDAPALAVEQTKRDSEKDRLLRWFEQAGVSHFNKQSDATSVYECLIAKLATSSAAMLCIQLDDLDQQDLPVNIPGTYLEYPNWRRRLKHSVSDIFTNKSDFINSITQSRKGL
ncbi:4-alpha-glucanotransferase [Pseudoalteromonas sp. S16_S37]|uniref:4-alpha-glucanotransferase n=1 Tax=Pseudoalteromonas sp. S16_S37 TaxID=2720228 RepID=UPI001680B3F8|nr:4-alpha-glucanotransferase [Pseudoalteromonas sp. S16_S37]MBD1583860.1 4-alpha-glucanotransferase [Pseudoalteromonas sp. S16_S37]